MIERVPPVDTLQRCFDLDAALRHAGAVFEGVLGPCAEEEGS